MLFCPEFQCGSMWVGLMIFSNIPAHTGTGLSVVVKTSMSTPFWLSFLPDHHLWCMLSNVRAQSSESFGEHAHWSLVVQLREDFEAGHTYFSNSLTVNIL